MRAKATTAWFTAAWITAAWITAACLLLAIPAQAATLQEIYEMAILNDPQLGVAAATYNSRKEVVSQARAALLPQIGIGGSESESKRVILDPLDPAVLAAKQAGTIDRIHASNRFSASGWQATLRQSVFNLGNWFQFRASKNLSAAAEANFAAAQQDLIVRVAVAYFGILEAQDLLTSSNAEADAVKRQLEQVQQRFDVGLVAITDVLESTAAYDSSAVRVIESEGLQVIQFESLFRLTGDSLSQIVGLKDEFPVAYPEPRDPQAWVETALRQNYSIIADRENVRAAERQLKISKSGHLPTVDASLSYSHSASGSADFFGSKTNSRNASISLSVPIYSGGFTSSQVRKSGFDLEAAQKGLELTQKTVAETTRSLYSSIVTDVGKVEARLKGIASSQSALDATQTGYEVGTRNIVDVLVAQQRLYLAQFQYASARYQYITNTLRMKQASGTLSPEDIHELEQYLDAARTIKKLTIY